MTRIFFAMLFCLVGNLSIAQVTNTTLIKSKGDSVLSLWVGKGISRVNLKFKKGYHDPNDYRAVYTLELPENKYSDNLIIYFDDNFNVVDSNFFRSFPDYVLEDRPNDLISKDSAIAVAKQSGLCVDDILDVSFYRLYDSGIFAWVITTDNKKERLEAKRRSKGKLVRRASIPCRERAINAKTGEVIPAA